MSIRGKKKTVPVSLKEYPKYQFLQTLKKVLLQLPLREQLIYQHLGDQWHPPLRNLSGQEAPR